MPLTTIDGVLCCPRDEFEHLCQFLGLEQAAMTDGPAYTSKRRAAEEQGMGERHFHHSEGSQSWSADFDAFSYAPDDWLAREARKVVREAATSSEFGYAQIGEQGIDGAIWPGPDPECADLPPSRQYWTDSEGKQHMRGKADLSLTGPASLGGKILIELTFRLYVEVKKDKHVESQYAPKPRLDLCTLQPDVPAEK